MYHASASALYSPSEINTCGVVSAGRARTRNRKLGAAHDTMGSVRAASEEGAATKGSGVPWVGKDVGAVTEEARELAAVVVVGCCVQHHDWEAVRARATHFIRQLLACFGWWTRGEQRAAREGERGWGRGVGECEGKGDDVVSLGAQSALLSHLSRRQRYHC